MRNRARKNYVIYVLMLLLFGGLIYVAIEEGDRFSHYAVNAQNIVQGNPLAQSENLGDCVKILIFAS